MELPMGLLHAFLLVASSRAVLRSRGKLVGGERKRWIESLGA